MKDERLNFNFAQMKKKSNHDIKLHEENEASRIAKEEWIIIRLNLHHLCFTCG